MTDEEKTRKYVASLRKTAALLDQVAESVACLEDLKVELKKRREQMLLLAKEVEGGLYRPPG